MPRILFLTQVLPYPLDAGPKLRAYYVLRYLAQKHTLTLLSFTRPSDPPDAVAHLQQFCEQVLCVPMPRSRLRDGLALLRSLVSGASFIVLRDQIEAMRQLLRRLSRQGVFDAVHADQLWMAPYALQVKALQPSNTATPNLLTVLDQHNAVFHIPQRMAGNTANPLLRWALHREARLLADYEARLCQQFDRVTWVAPEDRLAVQSLSPAGKLAPGAVIPICIDASAISAVQPLASDPNLLFVGGMHWPPNAQGVDWFIQRVFPAVQDDAPQATFYAVGKSPPASLVGQPAVIAPGYVADVEPYWRHSRAFIVPLLAGGGMRVKILDAWAHGLPVVSTAIGAEGLQYLAGENILIADHPSDFAQAILRLLHEPGLAERLAANGRRWVEEHYDWKKIYPAWDQIYAH